MAEFIENEENKRFHINYGKFGAYIYDKYYDHDLTLWEICHILNLWDEQNPNKSGFSDKYGTKIK